MPCRKEWVNGSMARRLVFRPIEVYRPFVFAFPEYVARGECRYTQTRTVVFASCKDWVAKRKTQLIFRPMHS